MKHTDGKCDRCHKNTNATIMSKFNEDMICMECKDAEKKHPKYMAADLAEVNAVRSGDMNFKGVGLPKDLR